MTPLAINGQAIHLGSSVFIVINDNVVPVENFYKFVCTAVVYLVPHCCPCALKSVYLALC